ncbi:MAG: O-antigen ligase family protein [Candidatus Paceibacteria bacterium]
MAGILVTVTAVNPGLLGLSLESVRVAPVSRLTDVGIGLEIKRTPGVAQSHGYFGSIICSSFFSTIGLYLLSKNSKSSVKYIYVFIGVVIAFTGLIVSQSRSMLAAILFSCSVFALLGLHNKDVGYFVWLVAGSMAFLIGSFLVNHFSDILMSNINSVYKRASILRLTLSKINENFLVGYGLSTQYVIEIINSVSHNTFIGIWARFGLFALISYVSIMFYSIYSVIHTMGVTTTLSILSAILLSILSAHIIEMMFYNGFGNPIHYILYGIMLSTNKI